MCFLFVDRIVSSTPGKLIRGLKHVTWDDVYWSYDHAGEFAFAPSLIGETLGQLAAWNVMVYHDFTLRPVAGIVASARLFRAVHPGETLLLESVIDDLDDAAVRYHSIAKVGEEPVFVVEGAIGPLLPMTNFIDRDVVRRQFNEINRTGDWDLLVETMSTQRNVKNQHASFQPVNFCMQFDNTRPIESGTYWMAEKRVSRTASYFPDHFPNNPVLPMTVLLECKLNLAHQFALERVKQQELTASYQVSELRRIKMNDFIHPGDVVVCHLKLKQHNERELVLSCQSLVDGKRVCVVEIVMTVVDN